MRRATLLSTLLALGILGLLTRRNAVNVLMSIELILNSAGLNLIAFSRYGTHGIEGNIFVLFIIVLAAADWHPGVIGIVAGRLDPATLEANFADLHPPLDPHEAAVAAATAGESTNQKPAQGCFIQLDSDRSRLTIVPRRGAIRPTGRGL